MSCLWQGYMVSSCFLKGPMTPEPLVLPDRNKPKLPHRVKSRCKIVNDVLRLVFVFLDSKTAEQESA